MRENEQEWLKGRATLGAATKWTPEEIRLVTEFGYGLAENGRVAEAITLFEGLAALAPATVYFRAALGALWLRENAPEKALAHLNAALASDSKDFVSLVNRGEAHLRLGDKTAAVRDFQTALKAVKTNRKAAPEESIEGKSLIRARALLNSIEQNFV